MNNSLLTELKKYPIQVALQVMAVLPAVIGTIAGRAPGSPEFIASSLALLLTSASLARAAVVTDGVTRWGWAFASVGYLILAPLIPMTFLNEQMWPNKPLWWHLDLMHFLWLMLCSMALILLTSDDWLSTWRYAAEFMTIAAGLSMFVWLTPYGVAIEEHTHIAALIKTFQAMSLILLLVVILLHVRHKARFPRVSNFAIGTGATLICSGAIAVAWTFQTRYDPTWLFIPFHAALSLVWFHGLQAKPHTGAPVPPMKPLPIANLMLIVGMSLLLLPVIQGTFARVAVAQALTLASVVAIRSELNNSVQKALVDRLKTREAQLEYEAYHDSLTGLDNRSNFMRELQAKLDCVEQKSFAVVFADVDNFKEINDRFGHIAGDTVLKKIADHLRKLGPEVVATARLSGDEFASIVIPPEHAPAVAQRIVSDLRSPVIFQDRKIVATASVGVVEIDPAEELTPEEVLTRADLAMYTVKKHGRDDFAVYSLDFDDSALDDRLLAPSLGDAIMADEIQVHYQPIFDVTSGDLTGFEALARWTHEGKPVPANRFIALAERTGLIRRLTDGIIDTVCKDLKRWKGLNPEIDLEIGVNISGVNLGDADMLERIVAVTSQHGIQSKQLTLEVTETMPIPDAALAADLLNIARDFGFHVALDDFGTGTNSISHLLQLPLDRVKIDPTMVRGLEEDDARSDLVGAMIALSQHRNLLVIVEGVETEAEARVLRNLGADRVQGYFYGRPMLSHYWDQAVVGSRPVVEDPPVESKPSIISRLGGIRSDSS